ncbi:MAG: hypothetical protein ACPLUL_05950 [Thermanaerothrix sp.]|uniref:hypothetical protein n=1 Tax=Thermanaerothrix sp. TaxID=2972675 RepID=UPI003C7CB073
MIDEHFTGRTAYVGYKVKRRPRLIETIGFDHQPDCACWHGKPCNCQPVRVVIRGRRIIREVRREN